MQTIFKVGDNVKTIGKYSGIISKNIYKVVKVSATGNKVTIAKPEFTTGFEEFNKRNKNTDYETMCNDYTGYLIKV